MGVSFRKIDKFVSFAREKIFHGVFEGAEFTFTIFPSHSPLLKGVANKGLGVNLCKTRKNVAFS